MNYEEIIEATQRGFLDAVQEIERSKDVPDDLREEAVNVIVTWPRDPRDAIRRALELAANVGAHGAGKLILDAGAPTAEDHAALAELARVEAQQIVQTAEITAEGMITTAKQMTAEAQDQAQQIVEAAHVQVDGLIETAREETRAEAKSVVDDAVAAEMDGARADAAQIVEAAQAEAAGTVNAADEKAREVRSEAERRADTVVSEAQQLATEAAASITEKAEKEAAALLKKAKKGKKK